MRTAAQVRVALPQVCSQCVGADHFHPHRCKFDMQAHALHACRVAKRRGRIPVRAADAA